jgi:hypothetical protein
VATVDGIGNARACQASGKTIDRSVLKGNIRVNDFPTIAVDNSLGPYNGNIYIAWNDNRFGSPDILLSRSTNGGMNWDAPVRVNDDTKTNDQFMPWMSVDPNGNINIIWYDRRLDDPANMKIDVFYARSADGGQHFNVEPNRRITDVSFDVSNPPNSELDFEDECYMGDYINLASDAGRVYATWGDNRVLHGDRPDPNVFFAVIPEPVAVLQRDSPLYALVRRERETEWSSLR